MFGWLVRRLGDAVMDDLLRRIYREHYTRNIYSPVAVIDKVGLHNFIEAEMRAAGGKPLERPLGSPVVLSAWEQILLNPVHLHRFPTPAGTRIDTRVVIGPRAQKPLQLKIPLMIAGMSYGGALSLRAKIALAQAATRAGTATNSGEAPLIAEEREAARYFIGQYSRSGYMTDPAALRRLDAIEIQLAQGAQAAAPLSQPPDFIGPEMRERFHLKPGQFQEIPPRLPGVNTRKEFGKLVGSLRKEYGVPVGVKFAATHHLEKELAIALEAGVDFIVVDGSEGGTHAGPPILQDDVGLPTLPALIRSVRFLERSGVRDGVSLIIAGGLFTPGQFLKALALGADALYIGTIAVIAMLSEQLTKAMLWEPPTQVPLYTGKYRKELDVKEGATRLYNFLMASVKEMELATYALGKRSFRELDRTDLTTMDREIARAAGIQWAYLPPEEQEGTGVEPVLPLPSPPGREEEQRPVLH
jgi:glutamate synthase domain-containing protein 2